MGVTRKTKTNDTVVLHQPSAMEDFNKIGLLDFQSKNGISGMIPSAFNSFSQNSGFLPFKEPALPRVNQNTTIDGLEDSKNLQGSVSAPQVTTCNLDELMSGVSLMYVSGDSQGLDNSKLQLEICTNDCCSSRVKYARVHREKDNDVWSKTAIGPLVGGGARARSSWDLGSDADGSSTPGSASWGDMFGVIGRSATQWPAAGDFGFGKNQVFLDAGRGDHFDAWAACDAFLETDLERGIGTELHEETGEYDQWNSARKTFRKPQI